jgi:alpha-D-ribose 1-methylphosphonate 5-triphosphate synthase subunit PhnL
MEIQSYFVDNHDLIVAYNGKRSASWVRRMTRTMKDAYGVRQLTVKMVADYLGVQPKVIAINCRMVKEKDLEGGNNSN